MKIMPTTNGEFRGKRSELNVYDDAMDIDMQRVTLTLCYLTDKPNKNGTIFTNDAIKNAFEEAKGKRIPVVDYTKDDRGSLVGISTPSTYQKTDDGCSINYDSLFFDDTKRLDIEYMINKFHKDQDGVTVIDDFKIIGMSVVGDEL